MQLNFTHDIAAVITNSGLKCIFSRFIYSTNAVKSNNLNAYMSF